MSPDNTTVLGRRAEDLACRHLEAQVLRLLERNYRCRAGELDLVMRDGDTIAFVEVRYRADDRYGGGLASVDRRKCRRIALAARAWLQRHPALADAPCRFDIVAASPAGLEWHRGAFTLDDL